MNDFDHAPGARSAVEVQYAVNEGVSLVGDLYAPQGATAPFPVLVAVHGGGWQGGDRKSLRHWGLLLAREGYGLFAIKYRTVRKGAKAYPDAVDDVQAALAFVASQGRELGIDPERVGLFGVSAGAQLAALAALADRGGTTSSVKVVVGASGIYDMKAQWDHELSVRPRNNLVEKFLGVSPMEDRRVYFDSSPISYVTHAASKIAFLLAYGLQDDVVNPSQSILFSTALGQAGFFSRTFVLLEAGHFWASDPIDEAHSLPGRFAPVLLRFLSERL